jgi:hypothetical protein
LKESSFFSPVVLAGLRMRKDVLGEYYQTFIRSLARTISGKC